MKKVLLVLSISVGLAACRVPVPEHLDPSIGNGPLTVDLGALVLSTSGEEVLGTVRGPDRGTGERGGVTASFIGRGGPVCVIMDPENVYEGSTAPDTEVTNDDGDIDLFVGLAADYTGTPGVVFGDFIAEYVDPLGVVHPFNQNLCVQTDVFGDPGAHAGMGTVEYCAIETVADTPYMVIGETWKVPVDDDLLSVAIRVTLGGCPGVNECTLLGDNSQEIIDACLAQ